MASSMCVIRLFLDQRLDFSSSVVHPPLLLVRGRQRIFTTRHQRQCPQSRRSRQTSGPNDYPERKGWWRCTCQICVWYNPSMSTTRIEYPSHIFNTSDLSGKNPMVIQSQTATHLSLLREFSRGKHRCVMHLISARPPQSSA